MVDKGNLAEDPRGLIFESFRIEGITREECRSIFFDWAMGVPAGEDMHAYVAVLLDTYGVSEAGHPMISVLEEGRDMPKRPERRGGRRSRVG